MPHRPAGLILYSSIISGADEARSCTFCTDNDNDNETENDTENVSENDNETEYRLPQC